MVDWSHLNPGGPPLAYTIMFERILKVSIRNVPVKYNAERKNALGDCDKRFKSYELY